MYDSAAENIKNKFRSDRSVLAAQSEISKANNAMSLSQKGLSKSGESVQSELLSDMSYMNALSNLADSEASELSDLYRQRQSDLSSVHTQIAQEQNKADLEEQQVQYQKERDDINDEKWQKEFDYNLSRDKVQDDKNDREYQFKLDEYLNSVKQQEFENEMEKSKLELDRLKSDRDNYIKNQYLAIEKESSKSSSSSSKSADLPEDIGYIINDKGFIVPTVSPDEFIDIMLKGYTNGKGLGMLMPAREMEYRVNRILRNNRIDAEYRTVLEIYAKARGILN